MKKYNNAASKHKKIQPRFYKCFEASEIVDGTETKFLYLLSDFVNGGDLRNIGVSDKNGLFKEDYVKQSMQ